MPSVTGSDRPLTAAARIRGAGSLAFKSYSFSGDRGTDRLVYMGGSYHAPEADANLSDSNPTQTLGVANHAYGAHVFAVAQQAGATDGSDLILTVSGTSITDLGIRTDSDSETLVIDATAAATHPCMKMRPIHRPPRNPGDRVPHCRWSVFIDVIVTVSCSHHIGSNLNHVHLMLKVRAKW